MIVTADYIVNRQQTFKGSYDRDYMEYDWIDEPEEYEWESSTTTLTRDQLSNLKENDTIKKYLCDNVDTLEDVNFSANNVSFEFSSDNLDPVRELKKVLLSEDFQYLVRTFTQTTKENIHDPRGDEPNFENVYDVTSYISIDTDLEYKQVI